MQQTSRILLIIAGGIAAYKSLEVIRRLREQGIGVRCILTAAGAEFVTPLAVASLSGERVFTDLFSLSDEAEMGHIQLSREADLVVVAPATADLIAKMAHGLADDLASTALLATDKPVLIAPAMNPMMWDHSATRRNVAQVQVDGIRLVGPNPGDMACGETGIGRMAEPEQILAAIQELLAPAAAVLRGRTALVTSGPTFEAIDPVRFIANRSSGKQGHAIAAALARAGADVTLVSGPVHEDDPAGVRVVRVESAREMLEACLAALPVDVSICAAAVADWRVAEIRTGKIKKEPGRSPPTLILAENPDILQALSRAEQRPRLVIGFAAETEDLVKSARRKLAAKGCDWIVANDVSIAQGTFGGAFNTVQLIRSDAETEVWPRLAKVEVAARLVARIAAYLERAPVAAA
ncbi:MAG TPA: bifunctional phosphopantothenoylcysteine decarboxylase/phosphopantothenate--cysteine ligase CoaBC [Geminicoccaceae bacterium]|jgi:phosphopantothenoylcysteine decarboxylase/phosphopantothenate--cysteine ligase|nr:bifunctional phosphopantothenoylcysteine decarboxylase/phosphopantothenate--cysteine ligase CoaBC [Geminicoccaceae bacterium]